MPTLAVALLQALKDHGAREIFGIPGDFVLPLFKVIEESAILPHFTLSHDPAVGFAAGAAARAPPGRRWAERRAPRRSRRPAGASRPSPPGGPRSPRCTR